MSEQEIDNIESSCLEQEIRNEGGFTIFIPPADEKLLNLEEEQV